MKLTWVPSKAAMEDGIVPDDYSQYDIDVLGYLSPELAEAIRAEAPAILNSVETAATRAFRHAYNNEAASKWGAAVNPKPKKDGTRATPIADTVENRKAFLHEWRTAWRDEFIAGNLGIRGTAPAPIKTEMELALEKAAGTFLQGWVVKRGGTLDLKFPLTAKSLAIEVDNKSVGDWIADLLDANKAPKRAAQLQESAEKAVAEAAAERARLAESVDEDDDEMAALMAAE